MITYCLLVVFVAEAEQLRNTKYSAKNVVNFWGKSTGNHPDSCNFKTDLDPALDFARIGM